MRNPDSWEPLFWTAFNESRNPMALVDGERRYVEINRAIVDVFGYSRTELVGRRVDEVVAERERATVPAEFAELLRSGKGDGERELYRANGDSVIVRYTARIQELGESQLALYVATSVSYDPRPPADRVSREPGLSPREREVVCLVTLGKTTSEIASRLHLSPETVRTHIRNAMAKTETRTRAQLAAKAVRERLLAP